LAITYGEFTFTLPPLPLTAICTDSQAPPAMLISRKANPKKIAK
jgi:hypothetical protein